MALTISLGLLVVCAALFATELTDTPARPPILNGERLLSFSAIAPKIPGHRGNSHVNASTLFRWATKGLLVNGTLIKLEAVRLGSSWKTSFEAVARFSDRLTAAALPTDTPPTPPAPTPAQRSRAAAAASRDADRVFGSKGE